MRQILKKWLLAPALIRHSLAVADHMSVGRNSVRMLSVGRNSVRMLSGLPTYEKQPPGPPKVPLCYIGQLKSRLEFFNVFRQELLAARIVNVLAETFISFILKFLCWSTPFRSLLLFMILFVLSDKGMPSDHAPLSSRLSLSLSSSHYPESVYDLAGKLNILHPSWIRILIYKLWEDCSRFSFGNIVAWLYFSPLMFCLENNRYSLAISWRYQRFLWIYIYIYIYILIYNIY